MHLAGQCVVLLCRKTCGHGPGPFFGEYLLAKGLAAKVGLVACAVGGTSMTEWRQGGPLFQQMVRGHGHAVSCQLHKAARNSKVDFLTGRPDWESLRQLQRGFTERSPMVSGMTSLSSPIHISIVSISI